MDIAVKIKNASVVLGGSVNALDNINVELPANKSIGFIGPSGAGKTTLIRSIVGRQKLTGGKIEVFGQAAGSKELRKDMSYMTQEISVYPDLTVRENLRYFAIMAGLEKKQIVAAIDESLRDVELQQKADRLVRDLSGGQKQRVSLAVALLGSPKLMVLDEPTTGLDPTLRESLWGLFDKLKAAGTSLMISSHSMDEAERCDYLLLVRGGAVIAQGSPAELMKQTNTKSIEAAFLKIVRESK
ncbi:ABC transporter ATP-binding protein [Candidatus Saccharibacteria bacterium]|nr:ABC transporter ATP-binding protein [Candidatus Saccharibacteria bacterium]